MPLLIAGEGSELSNIQNKFRSEDSLRPYKYIDNIYFGARYDGACPERKKDYRKFSLPGDLNLGFSLHSQCFPQLVTLKGPVV